MNTILSVAYICYILFTVIQLAVLVINDFSQDRVSWGTLIYPTIVTAAVVMFNWEFSLLLNIYEKPADMFVVWVAFLLLTQVTYWSYAYYPQMRKTSLLGGWRINPRYCNPDNGPPIKRTR